MAEDLDRSPKTTKAAWLKIFTGFKLALDPKKLVLAAAGIFSFLPRLVVDFPHFFRLEQYAPRGYR